MIMGPFKPYVQYALNKLEELELNIICPGHGPVLREDLNYYLDLYDKWSQQPEPEKREKPLIINSYVSAYGYTEELASEINKGIKEVVDVEIRTYDMVYANSEKVLEEMKSADGILVGSPTVNGDVLPPVMDLIMGMNGVLDGGKVAGAYGSYGWSGEGPEMLMSRLQVLRMNTVEPALKICFKPDDKKRAEARDYGKRFGKKIIGEWEKLGTDSTGKTYWKCTVCGEIFEGALPPISCPVCGVGPEGFIEYIPEVINYKEDREIEVAIIGSGIGAVSAAEAVRVRNKTAKITIYTNEKIYPYHRPVLTKAISEDLTKEELYIYPEEYYKENSIDFELGVNVEKINKDNKSFELNNNQTIHYDKLIIATGARCFIPPFPGADLEGIFTLRKFSDLIEVREILDEGIKNVVVIGGGLLGLENADNIALKGHNVTVIEACPTILPRQLDSEAGTLFAKSIEESKVKLIKGVFVDEIIGDGKVKAVRTKDGEEYPCDLVLVSAGIRSNLELARDGGLETNRGIVVNSKMQTSDSNIYAVGDCAELDGQIDGIWETSLDQGKVAGANIAGDIKDYSSKVFGATLNAFGTSIFSIGDIGTDDNKTYQVISCKNEIKETYKKVYISNNKLVGGILIGNISQTNLLVQGVASGASVEDAIESKLI
jgi:NADPH-dependent 2,4-dienoyl-CoA reductase/sulfur reductase-like enzyme/rubredoxin/flavodoxin